MLLLLLGEAEPAAWENWISSSHKLQRQRRQPEREKCGVRVVRRVRVKLAKKSSGGGRERAE